MNNYALSDKIYDPNWWIAELFLFDYQFWKEYQVGGYILQGSQSSEDPLLVDFWEKIWKIKKEYRWILSKIEIINQWKMVIGCWEPWFVKIISLILWHINMNKWYSNYNINYNLFWFSCLTEKILFWMSLIFH